MSKTLRLQLDGAWIDFPVRRVFVAGFTARDPSQISAHIAELQRHGIPAPKSLPTLYSIHPSWVTVETQIDIGERPISGEAEPALLFNGNDLEDALVSTVVDLTDREEERRSILRSKELPKPMSQCVWRYRDVAGYWDEITLRSWVEPGPKRGFYQTGKLAELLPPRDLLAHFPSILGTQIEGTVLLMGTLPLQSPEFSFAEYFACELETPNRATLSCECCLRRSGPS